METTDEKAGKMLIEEGFIPKAEGGAEGYLSGLIVRGISPFLRREGFRTEMSFEEKFPMEMFPTETAGKGFSGQETPEPSIQADEEAPEKERLFMEAGDFEKGLSQEADFKTQIEGGVPGGTFFAGEVETELEGERAMMMSAEEDLADGKYWKAEEGESMMEREKERAEESLPFQAGLYREEDAEELLYRAGVDSGAQAARVLDRVERGQTFSEDALPFSSGGYERGKRVKSSFDTAEERILDKLEKRLSQEVACSAEGIYL